MPIQVHHHDSPLGRWTHAAWSPARLAEVVDSIWYFEGILTHPRERIFPDGRLELIVHLGPTYRRVDGPHTESFPTSCLSGQLLRSDVIEAPPGGGAVLGVRLLPAGAFALLRRPLHELTGSTVDLADLVSHAAGQLVERCTVASGAENRLRTAADWIANRVSGAPMSDPAVTWAAEEIERRNGTVSIAALLERTGWSKSRFNATFKEQVGVAPKVLARLIRFRRALELVRRNEAALVDVALATGYYDQPHFNAEFREITGFTPGDYLDAKQYPSSVSLAEGSP